jgi:FtsZ-interacting cell division protein ZipA
MIILSALAIVALLVFWAYRQGKRSGRLDRAESTLKKIGNINEFNRVEDEEAEKQVRSAGDNPVGMPWHRVRK